MKKINIILISLFIAMGFYSCQKDEMIKINPAAEDGSLPFVLNGTQYENYTFVLDEANNSLDMDALTTQQPDYGFTAAVTYYIQASFTEDMKDSVELASSVQGEKVNINVKDMAKAMFELYLAQDPVNGMPNPTVAKDIYVRLRAVISTATPTPLDNEPTVKSLYSNVVKLNILPYYIPNSVYYYEAKILKPYYIIGYTGWNNDNDHLGSEVIPLGVVEDKVYNSEGQGIWKFTGYFEASKTFKLIRDIGSWDEQWGNAGADGIDNFVHNDGNSKNLKVPSDGYYTITLNSITNTLTIEATDITPTSYASMGLIGEMTGWGSDIAMTAFQTNNNHIWYTTYQFAADSQCKLRANGNWDVNWGTPSANDADPAYSYVGLGKNGGKNMIETAGTYAVIFNDIDGCYYFIKK
ncbi:conserved hypothetical protein [uncultured Paludibacter sp.]|uniref:SusE outer membrane protein domain-containing protein n=1 Tax=uncultured Paludibacter sp. TaxID=497635 RepID=A0A653ACL7_9BACT|nr:conserved hypothetical protein [uncultured Paludibacter sp.]